MTALRTLALAGLLLTPLPALPVRAAGETSPVRSSTAAAVWSTSSQAFQRFLDTGEVRDRGLRQLIKSSGWTPYEIRQAFIKAYPVKLEAVAQFLGSEAGVLWLRNQTRSYTPFQTLKTHAPEALRAAILADAADGSISAAGIMAALPTDFRLTRGYRDLDGVQNVCAITRCEDPEQCTSLLSWFYFLPACVQANATVGKVDQGFANVRVR